MKRELISRCKTTSGNIIETYIIRKDSKPAKARARIRWTTKGSKGITQHTLIT
jgi:hypothetical protein